MKVGLFFGTFDPLHIGHDQIASYFLENYFDQIWFVVTPHNPHKEKLVLTDEKIRLEMVKKFCDSNVNFICSDVEFSLKQPNHTSDTVSKLLEMHPKIDFSVIIGQDNLMHFDKWKNYESILDEFPIVVFNRENSEEEVINSFIGNKYSKFRLNLSSIELLYKKTPSWIFVQNFDESISSTKIR